MNNSIDVMSHVYGKRFDIFTDNEIPIKLPWQKM